MSAQMVIHDGEADTALVAEYENTRRDALRRGIATGGTVLAAASIPPLLRVRNAFAQSDGDAGVLQAAVGLEQTAVFAYTAAARSGKLDAATKKLVELFRDQEQEHTDALKTALEAVGGEAPAAPVDAGDVKGLAAAAAGGQAAIARFAIELETMAVAAYYDASQKLRDTKLLTTGAQIMANEGQHLVVLRQALKQNPVPNAFESGKASR